MSKKNELKCSATSCEPGLQVVPGTIYKPRYTSRYDEEAWHVRVSLPGVTKNVLEVTVENEILEVRGTRSFVAPESWRALGEYPAEKHYRLRLDVGPEVDPSAVEASLEDGVLSLRLPLREEVKPRTIPVN
ncbi:MAG: Hsp20/alpha crystallin family protein [Verrucomicrobiota bacterium]